MRIFISIILLSVCSLCVKVKKASEPMSPPSFLQSKFERYALAQLELQTALGSGDGEGGSDEVTTGENSASALGQGIEDTAGAIVDLGNQAEGMLDHQNNKVNTSISASADATNAMMKDQISTKERDIDHLNK